MVDNEFTISVKVEKTKLTIIYGNKARNMQTCIRDFYSSVLHNKGYLGVSARNSADNIRSIDLNVIKVLNQDPNAYRDDSKDL